MWRGGRCRPFIFRLLWLLMAHAGPVAAAVATHTRGSSAAGGGSLRLTSPHGTDGDVAANAWAPSRQQQRSQPEQLRRPKSVELLGGHRSSGSLDAEASSGVTSELDRLGRAEEEPAPAWKVACNRRIEGYAYELDCPPECPFLRVEPEQICGFRCVRARQCGDENYLYNYPDITTMRCSLCPVAGCSHCISNTTCEECMEGYDLVDGECRGQSRFLWYLLFAIASALALFVVVYLVCLARRSVVNPESLEAGLQFRYFSKPLDKEHGNVPYDYWNTDLRRDDVIGVGAMLHFSWQYMTMAWGICVLVILVLLALSFDTRPSVTKYPLGHPRSYAACRDDFQREAEKVYRMTNWYTAAVCFIYVSTTIGCLVLARFQWRKFWDTTFDESSINDFALMAVGIPEDPTVLGPHEEFEVRLQRYFSEKLGLEVVGVTACWDYRHCREDVEKILRAELEDREVKYNEEARLSRIPSSPPTSARDSQRSCGSGRCWEFRFMDSLLGFGCAAPSKDLGAVDDASVETMLRQMKCCGRAIVVFQTEKDCLTAKRRASVLGLEMEGVGQPLVMKKKDMEPSTLKWESFGTSLQEQRLCAAGGFLFVSAAIFLLDLCFYMPYVHFIMGQMHMTEDSTSYYKGMMLGLFITVDNQILYFICDRVAEWARFNSEGQKREFYVGLYTYAVFVNTIVDLATVLLIVHGKLPEARKWAAGGEMEQGLQVIADHPSVQREYYLQLFSYLVPSCLILPFVIEPLFLGVVPYYLGRWLVQSRSEVTKLQAEDCLACWPYDLSRYGDIVINMALCALLLAFTYRELWMTYAALLVAGCIIYQWDRFRVLRLTKLVYFTQANMFRFSSYLTSLVPACLAGVIAFRIYTSQRAWKINQQMLKEQWHVNIEPPRIEHKHAIPLIAAFVVLHFAVHWTLLHLAQGTDPENPSPSQIAYKTEASNEPCTFFTANPIHCLRSKYLQRHKHPCTYFMAGKDYLIKPSEECGVYYDGAERLHPDLISKRRLLSHESDLAALYTSVKSNRTLSGDRREGRGASAAV